MQVATDFTKAIWNIPGLAWATGQQNGSSHGQLPEAQDWSIMRPWWLYNGQQVVLVGTAQVLQAPRGVRKHFKMTRNIIHSTQ